MTMVADDTALWTPRELAKFLGYSVRTVERMASEEPEKLPPRIATLSRRRWLPSAALQWAKENTGPISTNGRRNIGRPRRSD